MSYSQVSDASLDVVIKSLTQTMNDVESFKNSDDPCFKYDGKEVSGKVLWIHYKLDVMEMEKERSNRRILSLAQGNSLNFSAIKTNVFNFFGVN